MTITKRAVAYCRNPACVNYAQAVGVLEQVESFYCSRCRRPVHVERERHEFGAGTGPYPEVRAEILLSFDDDLEVFRRRLARLSGEDEPRGHASALA